MQIKKLATLGILFSLPAMAALPGSAPNYTAAPPPGAGAGSGYIPGNSTTASVPSSAPAGQGYQQSRSEIPHVVTGVGIDGQVITNQPGSAYTPNAGSLDSASGVQGFQSSGAYRLYPTTTVPSLPTTESTPSQSTAMPPMSTPPDRPTATGPGRM